MQIHKVSTKMAIQQTINYNSNNTYFTGFLQDLIDECEIEANVSQQNNQIILLLDDKEEDRLNKFSQLVSKYLPHSIFLGDIQTTNENIEINNSKFISKSYNISPCLKCIEEITDPSSQNYLSDDLICDHYSNTQLDQYPNNTLFSPHYTDNCTVLLTDTTNIDQLFIMTDDEKKALFSIEKPTIKVTILDETLKSITNKKFINIKAPYNIRSTLVALNAKDSQIPYLFFQDIYDLKVVIVQKNTTIIHDTKISAKLQELHENKVLNRFLNISQEAGFTKDSTGVNLSHTNGISFMVLNEVGVKEVIKFQTFNLSNVLQSMNNDNIKQKLLINLKSKYPTVMEKLNSSTNYDFFKTLCIILELPNENFEALSDKSLEFRGNGGLKIDTFFNDDGFDYSSFIGSVISFKLAGVDEHYLAYSIFEALADMSITTLNQLKSKFKIQNFVMMGDMFENNILYSRILSRFQLNNPYFSKSFALDN